MAKWKCFGCGIEMEQWETTSHKCKEQNMETREQMLERHARELAELDARWWEPWFTEDPIEFYKKHHALCYSDSITGGWIRNELPTIIRKREKLGVIICRFSVPVCDIYRAHTPYEGDVTIPDWLAERLAGRPLAPGEKVEL